MGFHPISNLVLGTSRISEQGDMSSLRRRPRSPAAPPPLEDDDLLSEILLRLPPHPSSLPRASAVCKRWRSLASDAAFSRRFRRHHRRSPPLLGFFHQTYNGLLFFVPTLEAPNRVPPGRFSLPLDEHFRLLGSCHGLVLIWERKPFQFLVWDPVSGQQHRLAMPPWFDSTKAQLPFNGAVLRSAAGDVQHFKVVLVMADTNDSQNRRLLGCVCSSDTGVWGNLISTSLPSWDFIGISAKPALLVGNSLYWILVGRSLNALEFDLETESLSVIRMPRSVNDFYFTVMPAKGGGVGFLSMSGFTAQFSRRKTDSDGVASWEMVTTIELGRLLSLNSDSDKYVAIRGFAEDNNLVYLMTAVSLFTIKFETLQFKKLTKPEMLNYFHPFESVYAAGI